MYIISFHSQDSVVLPSDTYSNNALDPLNIKVNFWWGGYVPDQYVPLNNTLSISLLSGQKFISVLPVIIKP